MSDSRRRRRTPAQLARQIRAVELHIAGKTIVEIARLLGASKNTINQDLWRERERRERARRGERAAGRDPESTPLSNFVRWCIQGGVSPTADWILELLDLRHKQYIVQGGSSRATRS